jgi:large subunit ribosomal protein L25
MELATQPRTVLGKKVKALRRQGIVPVHVFGPGSPSESLQASTVEVQQVLRTTGSTSMFKLVTGTGRAGSYDVMIRDVQRDPVTGALLHVDLYRVNLSVSVTVDLPVVLVGLSPAVDNHLGTLVHGINVLHIEGLPGDLPPSIEVDTSILTEPHQAIHARDIELPKGITLLSDPDQLIVNVVPPRGAEEVVTEAEGEVPTAEATAEGGEAHADAEKAEEGAP